MLDIEYHKGFNVIKSDKPGPVFVAPHSTTGFRSSEREDVGSENVAFLAVQKLGGSAVITSIPRLGLLGIDYNRLPPDFKDIKRGFSKIHEDLRDYYKNYSFTTESEEQAVVKSNIYKDFWLRVEELGKENPLFVFCHTLSSRLKNMPSVIDLITGKGEWISNDITEVAKQLNKKYDFNKYKQDIKQNNNFWLMLYKNFIKQNFGSLDRVEGMIKEWLDQDIANTNKILSTNYKTGEVGFELYQELLNQVLDKVDLKVTVESIFCGETALAVPPLLKKTGGTGIEIESISYLNEVQTELMVDIIRDILKVVK